MKTRMPTQGWIGVYRSIGVLVEWRSIVKVISNNDVPDDEIAGVVHEYAKEHSLNVEVDIHALPLSPFPSSNDGEAHRLLKKVMEEYCD